VKSRKGVLSTIHLIDHVRKALARFLGDHEIQHPREMSRSKSGVSSPNSFENMLGMSITMMPANISS
jgi:hypothetical protein